MIAFRASIFTPAFAWLFVLALAGCSPGSRGLLPPTAPGAIPSRVSHEERTPGTPVRLSSMGLPRHETAWELGLWPRRGPAVPLCRPNAQGGRCFAWIRTDVHGLGPRDTPAGYAPSDLQTAYGLTPYSSANGTGQTVALVEGGDDPNTEADLAVYRKEWGLPACTTANGCLQKKILNAVPDADWAGEESLDVDMVSAICPNCHILVVETKFTTADMAIAEQFATAHAFYVSNSYGFSGGGSSYRSENGAFDVPGVLIAASTGDSAYETPPNVSWPAALTTVLAVGGTNLESITPRRESAWDNAGSGCSPTFAKPAFQNGVNTGCTMRAIADVSASAGTDDGVALYDSYHAKGWIVLGGTSESSPIIAATFALNGCSNRCSPNPNNAAYLYAHASALNKVTSGSNGSCGKPLCTAAPGQEWNGPTGVGTPNGIAAFAPPQIALSSQQLLFTATGETYAQKVKLTQPNFSGAFRETDTCAKVASVTAAGNAGGKATYTITATGFGTCTATFAGENFASAAVQIVVAHPIVILHQNGSLLLTVGDRTSGIYMSQDGFDGPFTETNNCAEVANVEQAVAQTGNYGVNWVSKVTPVAVGSCTVTISGGYGVTATMLVDVAAPIVVSPVAMDFYATGSSYGRSVAITQASFARGFDITGICGVLGKNVVTYSVVTNAHGSATVGMIPQNNGRCSLTITGDYGLTATVPIYVGPASSVVASPGPYLALLGGSSPYAQTIAVSQNDYAGTLTESDDCVTQHNSTVDFAILTVKSNGDGIARYDAAPEHTGTCTATFSGGGGKSVTLPIVVATNFAVALWPPAVTITQPNSTSSVVAMQATQNGAFLESNDCAGIATIQSNDGRTFSIQSGQASGSCTATIAGIDGKSATLPIAVALGTPPPYEPVFVADTGHNAVEQIASGCSSSACVTALPGNFNTPRGVAMDQQGNLFVGDYGNNAVEEIPASCTTSACVTPIGGGFNNPWGVAVDGSDNVFVADSFDNAVKEIPKGCTSAACVMVVGGGFNAPEGVAVDGNDDVYVADSGNSAIKVVPSGCSSAACVTTIGGGFSSPVAVALDANGNAYVADYGNNSVDEIPNGCADSSCVTILGGGFNAPEGVAVDSKLNVYVGDYRNNAVKAMPSGCASSSCVVVLGGGFSYPSGLAVSTVTQQLRAHTKRHKLIRGGQ